MVPAIVSIRHLGPSSLVTIISWHVPLLLLLQVFFCKYNDPIYVKMEKLEIMIKLASEKNIDQVLLEFKEYAQEVDVDFVRKVGQTRQK